MKGLTGASPLNNLNVYETPNFPQDLPMVLTPNGLKRWNANKLDIPSPQIEDVVGGRWSYWQDTTRGPSGEPSVCNEEHCALTDTRTGGLTWSQRSPGFPDDASVGGDFKTFQEARKACSELRLGGYSDWRIPDPSEYTWLAKEAARFEDGGIRTLDTHFLGFGDNNEKFWTFTKNEYGEFIDFINHRSSMNSAESFIAGESIGNTEFIETKARFTWRCVRDPNKR